MSDYTPYQQKIIRNYYNNIDKVKLQRLAELVGEIYLATGKKQDKAWQSAAAALEKIGLPKKRIDHVIEQRNPELLAELVKELEKQ